MVENGAAAKPSAEQIAAWVATFTTYTPAEMKQIVATERFRLKPEGVAATPGPTDKDGLRAEHAALESKMAAFVAQQWPLVKAEPHKAAAGLPIEAQPRRMNDAHRAVRLW